MAEDIQSNIRLNVDTAAALSNIKALQSQLSAFYSQMAKSGAAANAVASGMQQNFINAVNMSGKFNASIQTIKTSSESFNVALEKNKFSLGQYFRYAVASTKDFGKVFKTEHQTITKVAIERVKDLQTQYIKLGRDANGSMKAIAVRPLTLDLDNLGTKTAIAAQKQQLLNQLLKQGSTNLLNWGKNTQWAGRQLMVGFTLPLMAAGSAAAKYYQELEAGSIKIRRVYGDLNTTAQETNSMVKQIQSLATEYTKYGVAVADTMQMAADAAAMGKTGVDLLQQVNEATKLSVLGGVDQGKALETTISLTNAFGLTTAQLTDKINYLNAVENQTVLNIDDMTTAIPKAAPVIKQLGGSVEDLAYFLTAMKEGGVNASEGANALKSGLASLINPTKASSDFLAGFGINVKKIVEGDKGNLKKTVLDFATALNTLDPLNRAKAIEMMFGKFQFSRISTLFQNITKDGSQASKAMELANMSSIQRAALARQELDKIQSSPMYKFQKAIADLQLKLAPVGETFLKTVTPIVGFVSKVLENFNKLGDGTKGFIVGTVSVLGGLAPVLLMVIGLIANGAANLLKFFTGIKNFFNKTTTASQVLGETTNYMTQEQIKAEAVAASLDQIHSKLKQTFTSEAAAVNLYADALQRANNVASQYTGPGMPFRKTPKKMAAGGVVQGPGGPTDDAVPTNLSNGEVVLSVDTVRQNPGIVAALLQGRKIKLPGFAKSGVAGDRSRDKLETTLSIPGGMQNSKAYSSLAMYLPENTAAGFGGSFKDAKMVEMSWLASMKTSIAADRDLASSKKKQFVLSDELNNELIQLKDIYVDLASGSKNMADLADKAYPKLIAKIEEMTNSGAISNKEASEMKRGVQRLLQPLPEDYTDTSTVPRNEFGEKNGQFIVKRGGISERTRKGFRSKVKSSMLALMDKAGMSSEDLAGYTWAHTAKTLEGGQEFIPPTVRTAKGSSAQAIAPAIKAYIAAGGAVKDNMKFELNKQGKLVVDGIVTEITAGIKEDAQVASPSKKTKEIGKNVSQGFIQGAEEEGKKANATGKTVSQAIINANLSEEEVRRRNAEMMNTEYVGMEREIAQRKALDTAIKSNVESQQAQTAVEQAPISYNKSKLGYNEAGPLAPGQSRMGKVATGISRMKEGLVGKTLSTGGLVQLTMAASVAAGALSAIPGPVGKFAQSLLPIVSIVGGIASVLSMFGITASIVTAESGALALAFGALELPLLPVIAGIAALAAVFAIGIAIANQVNEARKKELAVINASSNAHKTFAKTAEALAGLAGVTDKPSISAARVAQIKTTGATGTQISDIDTLLKSSEFTDKSGQTYKDIQKLKKMTNRESYSYLSAMGQTLIGQGVKSDDVDSIIKALQLAAGKKDLNLSFKSIDLTNPKNLSSISTAMNKFNTAIEKNKSYVTTVNAQDAEGNQIQQQIIDENKKAEFLDAIQSKASTAQEFLGALNDQYSKGIIDLKTYNSGVKNVTTSIEQMDAASQTQFFADLFSSQDESIKKIANGITSATGKMLLYRAVTLFGADAVKNKLGTIPQSIDNITDATARAAAVQSWYNSQLDTMIKDGLPQLKKEMAAINAALKDNTNSTGTAAKTLKDFIAEQKNAIASSLNQVIAFNKLRKAGLDVATAYKIVQDAELAAAIAKSKNNKEITKFIQLYKQAQLMAQITKSPEQRLIDSLQQKNDAYQSALDKLSGKEKEINKTYDKRLEALNNVQKTQEAIAAAQKDQLDVADALTRGDIAAAARAAQKMREGNASRALTDQKDALESARTSQLQSLTVDVGGKPMTREQIESAMDANTAQINQATQTEKEKEVAGTNALFQDKKALKAVAESGAMGPAAKALAKRLAALGAAISKENKKIALKSTNAKQDAKSKQLIAGWRAEAADIYKTLGNTAQGIQNKSSGGIISPMKFAMGGFANGTDTIPAMLSNGEYVIKASSVKKLGVPFLNKLNRLSGFADGGLTTSSYFSWRKDKDTGGAVFDDLMFQRYPNESGVPGTSISRNTLFNFAKKQAATGQDALQNYAAGAYRLLHMWQKHASATGAEGEMYRARISRVYLGLEELYNNVNKGISKNLDGSIMRTQLASIGNLTTSSPSFAPAQFAVSQPKVLDYLGTGNIGLSKINAGTFDMPASISAPVFNSPTTMATSVPVTSVSSSNVDNSSVYNSYSININAGNTTNPDELARVVINKIKNIDSQRIRSNRI